MELKPDSLSEQRAREREGGRERARSQSVAPRHLQSRRSVRVAHPRRQRPRRAAAARRQSLLPAGQSAGARQHCGSRRLCMRVGERC